MLTQLPKGIQERVISHLKLGDFCAAKALHDAWLDGQAERPVVKPTVITPVCEDAPH